MNSFSLFISGFFSPVKGVMTVFSRWRWFVLAILPFWICLTVAVVLLFQFWGSSFSLTQLAFAYLPWLSSFADQIKIGNISLITALFQGVFWFFTLVFISYFSYLLLSVVGAPFYSLMASSILVARGIRTSETTGFWHWVLTTFRLFLLSVFKLSLFIGLTIVLILLAFIPLFTVFVPFLFCLMIAYDCMDFAFENMAMGLGARWRFFKKNFALFFGMSFPILMTGSVPGLFVFLLPFFIAGAVDAFALTQIQGGLNER